MSFRIAIFTIPNLYFMKTTKFTLVLFLSFQLLSFSQNSRVHQNINKNKLALSGYDLIEYYNQKAIRGSSKFESIYNGSRYLFHTQKNKLLFEKNPEKYIPQYGGWCAYAMGYNGEKVSINPKSFSVENGKLYLFYKTFFNDTKAKWRDNTASLKKEADKNWNTLLNTSNHDN